ncbi:MAG: alpha/beta fold hydrolase [Pseudomonadota bacterium]
MDGEIVNVSAEKERALPPEDEVARGAAPDDVADAVDEQVLRALAQVTGGASPIALATAWFDWAAHMAIAPARRMSLMGDAAAIYTRAILSMMAPPNGLGGAGDASDAADEAGAFIESKIRVLETAFDEWDALIDRTADAPGVERRHRDALKFFGHLMAEPWRPENNFFTNKEALERTFEEGGANLVRGWEAFCKDTLSAVTNHEDAGVDGFKVGVDLAASEGVVVFKNDLFELIQYAPTTDAVKAEPVFIVPAWIMKYYILDLSPHNSLVRFLTGEGFTVYMMSWRNPGKEHSELSFDDYREKGVMTALDVIEKRNPSGKVHGVGYCLGGTLLSIAAAAMARAGDKRLASVTLLAAQTDFRDAGELSLFIGEDQLEWLEASMDAQGYLGVDQMAGAFRLLRARELIWGKMRRSYFLGEEDKLFDLLVWNADATRMPRRMHSEYLRKLFLHNDFVQGRFEVDGEPVAISDIRAPIFVLGTEKDHVAPWRSVYKIHLFADADITFVLTNGGHNAGVVSQPGRRRRRHFVRAKADLDHYVGPDEWRDGAEERDGSWWLTWAAWLGEKSSGSAAPPALTLSDHPDNLLSGAAPSAPGAYILEK